MSDDLMGADQRVPTAYLPKGEATTLAPGTVIQGRYQIDRVIGIGGMGAVYRVRDTRFKDAVKWDALKEMIIKFADNLDQQTRMRNFEREANLLASLNHPLIPKVNDFFAESNRAYLVLDYIQGKNLEDVLMETQGFLDEQQVTGWAIQICQVLEYLHAFRNPIIFRDLKPSNVMLTPQNQTMLIDFGIAKIIQPDRRDTMIGTEGYSPPEQYKGFVDPRSDIYALGAMLHQLLTGSDPRLETPFTFHERPPRMLNSSVSAEMESVIMKCLAYQADQRWQSATELREALQQVMHLSISGSSLLHIPTPIQPPAQPPASPKPQGNGHHTNTLDMSLPLPPVNGVFREVAGPRFSPEAFPPMGHAEELLDAAPVAPPPPSMDRSSGRGPSISYSPINVPVPSPTLLWSFKTEEEVRSSPALAQNTIYIGSYDYNLYALDAGSGAFKWKFPTEGGICCTPYCSGELVIFGSEDHKVYAVNSQTKQEAWNYPTWNHVRSSPRVIGDLVVVGSDDHHVHAIDLRGGRQVWKFKTWREVRSSAVHHQGMLYIGSDDEHIYAIDAATGREKWNFATQYLVISSPALGDGMIFVGSMDGIVYGIDMALGWTTWKHRTGDFVIASPTLYEGRVYIGSVDKSFYCLDARTGRQLWRFPTDGQITSTAAVAAGYVYFGCSDGAVYCLDARNGQIRWKFQTGGPVPSSPLVRDGVLYIGSNDHYVYALRCAM